MHNLIDKQGFIYNKLSKEISYNDEMKSCIETTVENLIKVNTTSNKPGMLLGKIQSGKTRAFIGTMGLAFDNGYDIAIVLTKGTRALAEQTFQRLNKDFSEMIENDIVQVFDIMHLADNLRPYELNQKIIFIVKKEVHNLDRLYNTLFQKYNCLSDKKILIIDDEADYASVGFIKTKQEGLEIKKIAGLIDTLRNKLKDFSFLQVTATPYSLYLQPEDMKLGGASNYFKPVRPAFTVLVPIGKGYIGGNYYFNESEQDDSIASHIHESVNEEELTTLKKEDRRRFKIEEALMSSKVKNLRSAIINFIVGGCIRRLQEKKYNKYPCKYSFIIHTEQAKSSHEWQEIVINKIIEMLSIEAKNNSTLFNKLIREGYDDLIKSLILIEDEESYIPDFDITIKEVINSLVDGYIMIAKVNSENDINGLLDNKGQLKLRTPLNIFIGGQILDRGITIGNLIGFYYGRNPSSFQQDTVLQHSRMFGYRPMEDLAVTRFYTTFRIYDVMKKIQEFDNALREAFERGSQNNGVIFIQKDNKNELIPCSPNKVLLSKVTTLKPYKRMLPIGFNTFSKSRVKSIINKLDRIIVNDDIKNNKLIYTLYDYNKVEEIINLIYETLDFEKGYNWDVKAYLSSIKYFSMNVKNKEHKGKIWVIPRLNRNIAKFTGKGTYTDAPDTPRAKNSELTVAKQVAEDIPALIILRENGDIDSGWRGSAFWWPVLVIPKNADTVIFSAENLD